ncbi:hypothetical protein [Roseibium sp. LAB1]
MAYVQLAGALGLAAVAVTLLRLAYALAKYDRLEYEKSRARYPSFLAALKGQARVKRGELPDGRVRAGIVYNRKAHRIELNGKLRDDVVDNVL